MYAKRRHDESVDGFKIIYINQERDVRKIFRN